MLTGSHYAKLAAIMILMIVISFFRVVLMQETVTSPLLFLAQEKMPFSTSPRLQT